MPRHTIQWCTCYAMHDCTPFPRATLLFLSCHCSHLVLVLTPMPAIYVPLLCINPPAHQICRIQPSNGSRLFACWAKNACPFNFFERAANAAQVLSCYKRTAYPQCTPRKLCCAATLKGRFQGSLSVSSTPRRTIPKRDRFHPSSSRLNFHFCAIILPKYQFRADRSILPVHRRPPSVVRPESRAMSLKDWLQR